MPVTIESQAEPREPSSPPPPMPVYRRAHPLHRLFGSLMPESVWHNWCWDALAGMCAGIYQGCIWTFALQLARGKMRATGFEMGLASAAPAVGYLFAILWARQMEGRSKLPFVTVTWVLSRGLFLLTPLLVPSTAHTAAYVALICLTPVLFSVSTPAYTAIMKDIYPDHLRGRLMSYVRVGMATSMLLAARTMGVLQEHRGLDFRWMFVIGGVFGIGTAAAFSRLKLPPVLHAELPAFRHFLRDTFSILGSNVGYRWFCVSVFVAGFGNLLQTPAQYTVQVDRFHITPTQIATMQNLAGLLSLASLFFWGWYMDRFGSLPTVLAAVSVNCVAPLVYAFAPNLFWLYLAAACMGVSASGIDLGYLNTTLMFAEPGRAAQYQAVHSTLFGLRGTIAPLLTFAIAGMLHRNWPLFFLICLAVMIVGTLFQFFSMRTYRAERAAVLAESRA